MITVIDQGLADALGPGRYVAENAATREEAYAATTLALVRARPGDGYGSEHPHLPGERFYGRELGSGQFSDEDRRLLARILERVRVALIRHFTLPGLWLGYGHLVRRQFERDGGAPPAMSHPFHSDRAQRGNGWRTHSAIVFLNDRFEGGEFCFEDTPDVLVRPKPGRVVGFRGEDRHGVKRLRSGDRVVLAAWFGADPPQHVKQYHARNMNRRVLGLEE